GRFGRGRSSAPPTAPTPTGRRARRRRAGVIICVLAAGHRAGVGVRSTAARATSAAPTTHVAVRGRVIVLHRRVGGGAAVAVLRQANQISADQSERDDERTQTEQFAGVALLHGYFSSCSKSRKPMMARPRVSCESLTRDRSPAHARAQAPAGSATRKPDTS